MSVLPVRHSALVLADLATYSACADAIEGMLMHPDNIVGGKKAFSSGYRTYLTSTAQKKHDAIKRKMTRLDSAED